MSDNRRLLDTSPRPGGLAPTDLAAKVSGYLEAADSPNTRAAYQSGWNAFEHWCRAHAQSALPAEPAAVAAFLAEQAGFFKPSTLRLRIAAINHLHEAMGLQSPTKSVEVRKVLRGILKTHRSAPTKKRAFSVPDIRAICERLPDSLHGHRDRALLLVGFCGALRRSEVVNLQITDVEQAPEGVIVTIQESKTDQEGSGYRLGVAYGHHESTCPVIAVRRWLLESRLEKGPIFRGIDRHGLFTTRKDGDPRMEGRTVGRIVKARAAEIGLDPRAFGGHSLRSGMATSGARRGMPERQIAKITRHKSMQTLRGYIQEGSLFEVNVTQELGL